MFAVLGLGNPGPSYANTRHNIGFMVVETLASLCSIRMENKGEGYVWGRGGIKEREVVISKPLTFMNLSGIAAKNLLTSFGLGAKSLIVVYDDCDMPLGKIRIRKDGGSGGHRGVESIIEHVGADFIRVRMGIGRPEKGDLSDYVLSPFDCKEKDLLDEEIENAVSSIEAIIREGVDYAMNRYNPDF